MLRILLPDLEHVLQLAPPQNDIDHLVLGEGAGPAPGIVGQMNVN